MNWLNDDQHLLLVKTINVSESSLVVVDIADKTQKVLRTFTQKELQSLFGIVVAPDGRQIVVTGQQSTSQGVSTVSFLLGTDGHDLKTVPDSTTFPQFEWSPDGQFLAVVNDIELGNDDIKIVRLSDLSIYPTFQGLTNIRSLIWSPDSRLLLACRVTQLDGTRFVAGQTLVESVAAGSTPMMLFDKYVCPVLWVP